MQDNRNEQVHDFYMRSKSGRKPCAPCAHVHPGGLKGEVLPATRFEGFRIAGALRDDTARKDQPGKLAGARQAPTVSFLTSAATTKMSTLRIRTPQIQKLTRWRNLSTSVFTTLESSADSPKRPGSKP